MDSFDAPMLDYSGDMDVHMHTTVSSPKPWTPAETIMEEDVHPIPLPNPFPSHPQQDVEIDMDDYYNENVEYEMADGEIAVPDTELVDIDVYDAPREDAFSASAPISLSTGLTNQNIDKKTVGDHYLPSDIGVATGHIPADPDPNPLDRKSADPELLTPTIPQETVLQDRDVKLSHQASATIAPRASTSPLEAVSEDLHSSGDNSVAPEGHTIPLPVIAITDSKSSNLDTSQPLDESEQTKVLESSTVEHESSASVPQIVTPRAIDEGSPHQAEIQNGESHEGVRVPDEGYEGVPPGTIPDITDAIEPARPVVESHEVREEDNGDPHEISEGVYIEPPPPVLIELPSSSDQLVCALFNAPAILPSDDKEVNASRTGTSYIVLLQNRPTLYYETLNDVFDALREEERIQSMAEFVDGEMVIDAFDLQLVVSEVTFPPLIFDFALTFHENKDNVHAREISLHDLNILHHGLGFVGPLRLRIRAVFSRFIYRYRSLQDQIKRFNVSSTRHPAEDEYEYEGPREFLELIALECKVNFLSAPERDGQTKRELTGDGDHEGLTEGDVDEPEDVESTDHGHAEYQDEDEEEAYGESEQYADTQEYPPAHEDEAGTREETDQFVANDESEFVPDADGAHQGADPDLTEYQERDEEYEQDGVSGDVQATSPITVSMRAKESVLPGTELEVLTEVRESGTTGDYPQPEESEGKPCQCVKMFNSLTPPRRTASQYRTF
jgi:hypothetical protein